MSGGLPVREQCGLTCASDVSTLEQSPKRGGTAATGLSGPRRFERNLATAVADPGMYFIRGRARQT